MLEIPDRILVIDQNYGDVLLVRSLLDGLWGSKGLCHHAHDLNEAEVLIKKNAYSVVILDLALSESKGPETLRKFKEKISYNGAIIVFSELNDIQAGFKAIELGAEDFLLKNETITPDKLVKSLLFSEEKARIRWQSKIYTECLELAAGKEEISQIIKYVLKETESIFHGLRASLLMMDSGKQNTLTYAAPSIPTSWSKLICRQIEKLGTRAFPLNFISKKGRLLTDIQNSDDVSSELKEHAKKLNIVSVWVECITQKNGDNIGCFLFFTDSERKPNKKERKAIKGLKKIAMLLLTQDHLERQRNQFSAQFETLFATTPESAVLLDDHFNIIDVNPSACSIFQYTKNEFLKIKIEDLYEGGAIVFRKKLLLQKLEKGKPDITQATRVSKNGNLIPVEIVTSIIEKDSKPLYLELCRDIREQMQTEHQLRSLNDILRSIRNINRNITQEKDEKSLIHHIVDSLVAIETFYHAWIVTTEEDGQKIRFFAEKNRYHLSAPLREQLDKGKLPACMKASESDTQFYCKNGSNISCKYCPLEKMGIDHGAFSTTLRHGKEGKLLGYFSVATSSLSSKSLEERELFLEIAEDIAYAIHGLRMDAIRKENTLKYVLLAQNSSAFIWMISEKGMIVYSNPAGCYLTGFTEKDLMGNPMKKIIDPEDHRRWDEAIVEAKTKTRNIEGVSGEVQICCSDGSRKICEYTLKTSYDDLGNSSGFQGSFRDISERKKFEKQLIKTKEEAVKANVAKDEFLSVMSHELRTPLNPVVGLTQLMFDTCEEEPERGYYEIILNSVQKELDLIDNILDYVKLDQAEIESSFEHFGLHDLAIERINYHRKSAQTMGVEIVFESDLNPENQFFRGSKKLLNRVIDNLLENACKFTPKGEVTLTIRIESGSHRRDQVYVEVKDTGIGIPEPQLGNVFKPFHLNDSSLTRDHAGTGLGLAICKKAIELMGGTIGVSSVEGKGSSFWFRLELDR